MSLCSRYSFFTFRCISLSKYEIFCFSGRTVRKFFFESQRICIARVRHNGYKANRATERVEMEIQTQCFFKTCVCLVIIIGTACIETKITAMRWVRKAFLDSCWVERKSWLGVGDSSKI